MLLPGQRTLDRMLLVLLSVAAVYGCPDNISRKVHHCLVPYKSFYNSIIDEKTSLFTGIDVENLRSICVQVQSAAACVSNVERTCPERVVEVRRAFGESITMVNLCSRKNLYETYAIQQNCFHRHRRDTVGCHHTFSTVTKSLLVGVKNTQMSSVNEYCSHMETLLGCVKSKLESCGPIEDWLVESLVKPTVQMGHVCDVKFVPLTTPSGGNGKKASSQTKDNGAAVCAPFWALSLLLALAQVIHGLGAQVLVLR